MVTLLKPLDQREHEVVELRLAGRYINHLLLVELAERPSEPVTRLGRLQQRRRSGRQVLGVTTEQRVASRNALAHLVRDRIEQEHRAQGRKHLGSSEVYLAPRRRGCRHAGQHLRRQQAAGPECEPRVRTLFPVVPTGDDVVRVFPRLVGDEKLSSA